jgi:hypothetical protein
VRKVFLNKKIHDPVILPPRDYDSWKIGYCIIEPQPYWDLIKAQQFLQKSITLSVVNAETLIHPGAPKGIERHAL